MADGLSQLAVVDTWWPDDDGLQIAALTVAAAISEEELSDASAADEGLRLSVARGYVTGQCGCTPGVWYRATRETLIAGCL